MSAIIEEWELRLNTEIAEAAMKRFESNLKRSMDKNAKTAEDAGKQMEKKFANKMRDQFGLLGVTLGAVGAAVQVTNKAFDLWMKNLLKDVPKIENYNSALDKTHTALVAIKDAWEDPEMQGFFLRTIALMRALSNQDLVESVGRINAIVAQAKNRDAENAARMQVAADSVVDRRTVDMRGDIQKRIEAREEATRKRNQELREARDAAWEMQRDFREQVEALNAAFDQQLIDQEKAREDLKLKIAEDANAKMRTFLDEKEAYHLEIDKRITDNQLAAAREREEVMEKERRAFQQTYGQLMNDATMIFESIASTALDAMFAIAEGQEVSGKQLVYAFLKQTGMMMFGRGLNNFLEGLAMQFVPGMQATGSGLMTVGKIQMGAGAVMMAGALPMADSAKAGGGGGGGRGGGSDARAGAGASSASGRSERREPETIIINVNGVLTSKDAGREIIEAIERSRRKGIV